MISDHGCAAYSTPAVPDEPYHRNMDALQFLKHVMAHEKEWTLVLQERVKNLPAPPHRDRFVDEVVPQQMLDIPGAEFDTREIVRKVLYKYSTVGSFVEWAAGVLHKSLMCYSVRHLAFKSYNVSRLLDMEVEMGIALSALRAMKNVTVLFIDKLALLPADLELMFDTYWEVIGLMQNNVVLNVRPTTFPLEAKKRMDALHDRHVAMLNAECTKFQLDKKFFEDMDMDSNKLIVDRVLRLVIGQKGLSRLGEKHTKFVEEYYKDLGYETLPNSLWGQAFYTTREQPVKDDLKDTNDPIIKEPNTDPLTHEPILKDE